jgi:hypothetical protein
LVLVQLRIAHSSRSQKWWAGLAGLARQRWLRKVLREISGNDGHWAGARATTCRLFLLPT